jgi:hypothetical protein
MPVCHGGTNRLSAQAIGFLENSGHGVAGTHLVALETDFVFPCSVRGAELGEFRICQLVSAIESLDMAIGRFKADRDGTFLGLRAVCDGKPQDKRCRYSDQTGEYHIIA